METIQVVLDASLLKAADKMARRANLNRSALIRDALRAHLAALARRDREAADRDGYERQGDGDGVVWNAVAAWPAE